MAKDRKVDKAALEASKKQKQKAADSGKIVTKDARKTT